MNLLNDIGKKTSNIKNKLTEETKLKLSITKNKSKIEDLYEQIGKNVYEKHINHQIEGIDEILEASCIEIDKYAKEIEKANKQLLKAKNKKQCNNCYAELQINAKFCDQCGIKQEQEDSKENIIIEDVQSNED